MSKKIKVDNLEYLKKEISKLTKERPNVIPAKKCIFAAILFPFLWLVTVFSKKYKDKFVNQDLWIIKKKDNNYEEIIKLEQEIQKIEPEFQSGLLKKIKEQQKNYWIGIFVAILFWFSIFVMLCLLLYLVQ